MENINKKFEACPACGSKERFFETLAQQVKALGFAREEWSMFKDLISGVAVDKVKVKSLPIGAEVPSFQIATDVCLNCGTIYAVSLVTGTAKKEVEKPKLVIPGVMPLNSDPRRN